MKLVFRWMPLWLLAIVLPVVLVAAVILYRSDRRVVSPRRGWLLSGLRTLLVALLVVALLDPALVEQRAERKIDELLVIVDVSASMEVSDATEANAVTSRLERARAFLEDRAAPTLEKSFRVTWCALDGALREGVRELQIGANVTDLSSPIVEAVLRRRRDGLAGALLISDGNHNGSNDPRESARALARLDAPLFVLGVGAPTPPTDIALSSIDATGRVFAGDEIDIEVAIESRGIEIERLPVVVKDGEKLLARFELENVPQGGVSRWPLRVRIDEPGRRRVSIEVEPHPAEATDVNNRSEIWIDVLDAKIRVLYVDGQPRWEYRYLRNTWERDENIDLEEFLVSAPPERELPVDFPRTREKLFEFDVIVLGDLEPSLFTEEEQQALLDFVEARGGALVLLSGPRSMPYSWSTAPLAATFPVELQSATPGRGAGLSNREEGDGMVLTAAGEESPILRLVAGRELNVELWDLLPGPRWVLPVRGVADGATSLANARDSRVPVFASRGFGSGRVFYSGIDSTWRWRFRFGDLLYTRFWGQVARWGIADRLSAQDERARLGTDKVVYEIGEDVAITALVSEDPAAVDASTTKRVDAEISTVNDSSSNASTVVSRRVSLKPIPRSGGRFEGKLAAQDLAELLDELRRAPSDGEGGERTSPELEVTLEIESLPDYSRSPDRARSRFAVHVPDPRESADLSRNEPLLRELAALSGGRYAGIESGVELLSSIPVSPKTETVTETIAAMDFPWTLAILFIAILVSEWLLRKRWNLA